MSTPTTPTDPKDFRIWSDNAVRFVSREITPEEDQALIEIALDQQQVKQTLEIATLLLEQVGYTPDRPFLPLIWVKEELIAAGAATGAPTPTRIE